MESYYYLTAIIIVLILFSIRLIWTARSRTGSILGQIDVLKAFFEPLAAQSVDIKALAETAARQCEVSRETKEILRGVNAKLHDIQLDQAKLCKKD